MVNLQKTKKFMEKIGITATETEIYIKLLGIGRATMTEISRKAKIPRTTVYTNIEKLVQKGLVSQTIRNDVKLFIAENPNKIKVLIKQKEVEFENNLNEIRELQNSFPNIIGSLLGSVAKYFDENDTVVKYFEGLNGFREVCNRSLDHATDEILQISNCEEWRKIYTVEYSNENYVPIRVAKKIKLKALVLNDKEGKIFRENGEDILREVKFLPVGIDFKSTVLIYSKEVSIMLSSKPYTAILLHSPEIYDIFRRLFCNLWDISK